MGVLSEGEGLVSRLRQSNRAESCLTAVHAHNLLRLLWMCDLAIVKVQESGSGGGWSVFVSSEGILERTKLLLSQNLQYCKLPAARQRQRQRYYMVTATKFSSTLLVSCIVCGTNKRFRSEFGCRQTDRQTDPTTVTLAVGMPRVKTREAVYIEM